MRKVTLILCAAFMALCTVSCEKHSDGIITWGHSIHYSNGVNPEGIDMSTLEQVWDNAFAGIGETMGTHIICLRNTTEKQLTDVASSAAKKAEAAMPPATTTVKDYYEFTYDVYISLGSDDEVKIYSVTYNK